jgi:PadR family transcriptional regulator PadR
MLYPVLHRLENDGFITSKWKASDKRRLRKYYRLTDAGRRELEREKIQWMTVNKVIARLWRSSEVPS